MKTIVGLHAYEGGIGLLLREDIDALRSTPVSGICLFREGATVMAYPDGKRISLYNALDTRITKMLCRDGKTTAEYTDAIAPGEEKTFRFPFEARVVQVFTGETEASVYLVCKENFL